jgi:hypothetical protein
LCAFFVHQTVLFFNFSSCTKSCFFLVFFVHQIVLFCGFLRAPNGALLRATVTEVRQDTRYRWFSDWHLHLWRISMAFPTIFDDTALPRAPERVPLSTRRTPWPMPYSRPAWVLGLWGCWLHSTRALRCSPTSLATQQLVADPKIVFRLIVTLKVCRTIGASTMLCGGYKSSYILMGLYIQRILYVVNW